MAEDNSASFIPKRNPAKKIKRAVTRRVYMFTFFSYVLLFVALILSAVLFGYKLVLENKVVDNIEALNSAISSFSVADMQSVVELDARIRLAEERVANHLSTAAFLTLIEASTVQSVQFNDMNIVREADDVVVVTAGIITNDFDSALFQRQVYERSNELSGVSLEDIAFSVDGNIVSNTNAVINPRLGRASVSTNNSNDAEDEPVVSMKAVFRVNPEDIPFRPLENPISTQGLGSNPSSGDVDFELDREGEPIEEERGEVDSSEPVLVEPRNQTDL